MAFILFASTWLFRKLMMMPVMDINQLFIESWVIIVVYMIVGLFLARLGIALVMEVLEERRRREEERRERARMRYQEVIGGLGKDAGGSGDEGEFDDAILESQSA